MNKFNYASIDIGSNSINLLLAHVQDGEIISEETKSYITSLGEELSETGEFSKAGKDRAEKALGEIKTLIDSEKIYSSNVICVATEASRVASNSDVFFQFIKKKFDIETQIISAKEEARFTAKGAMPANSDESLLMDLGGASTEIIHFRDNEIKSFHSFKIGAVNIDPLFSWSKVEDFVKGIAYSERIVLVGGTAATVGASYLRQGFFNSLPINVLELSLQEFFRFHEKISTLGDEELLKEYPLMESRINSIRGGVKRILEILAKISPEIISFSTKGVRHGALFNLIENIETAE